MGPDELLTHFSKVRVRGPNSWKVCCTGHDDNNPSLDIDLKNGVWLFNCRSHQCAFDDIISGAGLKPSDVLPDRPMTRTFIAGKVPSVTPTEALGMLGHEIAVAVLLVDGIAANAKQGIGPSEIAVSRLLLSSFRINKIRNLVPTFDPPETKRIRRGEP